MVSAIKNRILLFRVLGAAALLPSIANIVLFVICTISAVSHGGPFTAITTVSTITSILSTILLLLFTVSPALTSSPRVRLISTIPTLLSTALSAATLIWMNSSRQHLPSTITGSATITVILLGFGILIFSIILQFLFWACLFFFPPPNRRSRSPHMIKGLPYSNTNPPARSHHNIRPFLADIKIPPPALDRNRSVVITVRDPARGSIISQKVHTPKYANPSLQPPLSTPKYRASQFSEHFRFSMPSIQNSVALPSPRRESTPVAVVPPTPTAHVRMESSEATEMADLSNSSSTTLVTSRGPSPPMTVDVNSTVEINHFDAWEPSSPSTAEIQRGVEAETKAAEAEERLFRSVGMGMAAKGKKRPGSLRLNQKKTVIDGRPCSPPLPKTPKTPGRRASEMRAAGVPVRAPTAMGR